MRTYPELEAPTGGVAAVATAVLPMFLDNRPLGTIILDFKEPHHFTLEEKRFLRTLALGRVRLLTRLQAQVQVRTRQSDDARSRAEVLAALGDALQAARSPEDVAALALGPLGEALGASSAMVVRLEDGHIRVPTVWGEVLPAMSALQTRDVPLEEATLLAACARTGTGGYYADYTAARGGLNGLPPLAFAVEPIYPPSGELVGFLCVWRGVREQP